MIPETDSRETEKFSGGRQRLFALTVLLSAVFLAVVLVYGEAGEKVSGSAALLSEKVLPAEGIILPAKWEDLGRRMVESGVIDGEKFEALYAGKGGLNDEQKRLLYGENNGNLKINSENAGFILNLLWALGLGNRNEILEKGPMADPAYGGADRFASTGGWVLADGGAMDHYGKHAFIVLDPDQQALVEKVSKNIYRPCCNNPAYFPDCNHGMAMLGLFELLASQGVSEEEMYRTALQVNSYWFPGVYLTIAKYFDERGTGWEKVNPREVLGFDFSSASGYREILAQTEPPETLRGESCGV